MKSKKIVKLLSTLALAIACGLPLAAHAAPAAPASGAATATSGAVVNINTATETELTYLPGIGLSRAQAIVTHRQKSPFKRIEDLVRIKGIGRKSLDKLRPHIAVNGPTTATAPIRRAR